MAKIANRQAREYVENLKEFKGSNLSGERIGQWYVVKSYGYYPILARNAINGMWYENSERYSVSTSRHLSGSRPYHVKPIYKTTTELNRMVGHG